MLNLVTTYYKTPIGIAKITGSKLGISEITVLDNDAVTEAVLLASIPKELQTCVAQLDAYFKNKRTTFNLKLNPKGTPFQKKVWNALNDVKFGKVKTYLEQSKALGDIKAIRAVANANGKNPIWIVIPCHRIIGSNGSLTGYAGGIWRKKWLLEHEGFLKQQSLF